MHCGDDDLMKRSEEGSRSEEELAQALGVAEVE